MADLPSTARVVIIGGGVVGASVLYHLAKAGWTDCLLLEKNELTAGSTWHAAGNIPTFSSSWSVMNMQRYSTELYRELSDIVDYPMNYHVTGSIRLGHTLERAKEFERVASMGRYQGMDIEVFSPSEIKNRHPFIESHDLTAALYDPFDGDIDPAQLTQAFAKGARDLGQKIIRFCPVTGVKRDNDEWVISTPQGDVRCEYVVNAAGYYAREVGKMFGRDVPMMVMSHQYILFEEIAEIKAWSEENGGRKLPLVRDVDSSYYLRQEKNGMNLGPYEPNGKAHWDTPEDPMPDDFSFQLFPDDLDRLEWYLEDTMARMPLLAEGGLSNIINGPIPYAPDGNPLIGPMPGVPNAFEACVFTFGICQAGGAGKVLTEWMTEGSTEWDMWSVDPRRFTGFCDEDYCLVKGREVYCNEYAMHFPHFVWPEGRNKRVANTYDHLKAAGAQFAPYNGWERANWFAMAGDDTSAESTQTWRREGPWHQRVREECLAVRDAAGLLDMPGFSRYTVKGEGARAWIASLTTGITPRVGRVGLGYFSDEKGRIVTEMSIISLADDEFELMTAAVAEWHDLEWLRRHAPKDGSITITNITDDVTTQLLTGPRARDILAEVCDADLSLPWLTHQQSTIAGVPVRLVRVSFAGELGWEVHSPMDQGATIYDALISAGAPHGLKPFGMFALDSLRLEKGYRTWKGDLSTDYTILQGGLDRFVKLDKGEFIGKQAIMNEQQQGVTKRFATLVLDAGEYDAPYMSTVWRNGTIVGETTSGGWGHRIDKSIALATVQTDAAQPGTELEVEVFGERIKATVQPDQPLWDPKNERLRA